MKLIKMLGAALLSCAALMSVGVNAQTPVSCTFTNVTVTWGPSLITANQVCKESNGTVIANRTISAPPMGAPGCSETLAPGITNGGTCLNPSFSRITTSCKNSGTFIAAGCANSMTSSEGFAMEVMRVCGGTSLNCATYQNLGGTNGCYRESPYLKAYCK